MFSDHISIPENYVGLVIGKKGKTLKKIEIKYGVKIIVEDNNFYLYTSNQEENIINAKNYIVNIYRNKILKDEKCPICLEKLDKQKDFVVTPCGHYFHFSCISESMKTSSKCPLCRTSITTKKEVDKRNIVTKTINQVRRTNFIFNHFGQFPYTMDVFNFQIIMEEFLREPLIYALNQVK